MKKIYVLLGMMMMVNVAIGQPWNYDFGTGTGTFASTTASTTFLPAPPSGTARVRVGTNPGSIVMANPGLAGLGTNTELQITSNTGSTSTTKFSVFDYTSGKTGYVKFFISFSGGTNGVYKFSLGDGANYSDNNAIGAAQIFAGIEWTLGASNAITYRVLNAGTYGTTGISNSTTLFTQSTTTVYQVEVYANNTTSAASYGRSGNNYNIATATWDLWVDGVLVGDDLAKGNFTNDVAFDSYAFNHQNSVTAPGTIYIDDIEYSNSLPPPTPTTTSITPNSATVGGSGFSLTVNGTNFINGVSTVRWNGSNRTTAFVSSTELTATINAADIASAGSASVDVLNTGNPTASNAQTFTINASGSPVISVSGTPLAAFSSFAGTPSAVQTYSVSGADLTDHILIDAPTGYQIRTGVNPFGSSITLTQSGGVVNSTNIDVRLNANVAGNFSGDINHSSTGATDQDVAVTGSVDLAAPVANAANTFTANSFTAGWAAVTGANSYRLDVSTSPTFQSNINATDLIISEYVEGSSNNKYIELYNGTGSTVDLSNYKLQLFTNGSPTVSTDVALTGNLANGSTIVYRNSSAAIYGGTTTVNAAVNFNGDDAVALFKVSTNSFVDIFGSIGEDPGTEWTAAGGYSTLNKTLRRKEAVNSGYTTNPTTGFPALGVEWDVYPEDNVADLGSHTYNSTVPSYLAGYENLSVAGTSQIVIVPGPGTYYFRARGTDGTFTSANSDVVTVVINDEDVSAFRSTASGNYDDAGTWEFNVSPPSFYAAATQEPTATNDVTVRNGHTVTLTGNASADELTLEATGNITLGNNNLSVNTVSGGSSSSYVRTNGTGVLTVNSIGTGPVLLPVGNSTYNPLSISNGESLNWSVRVEDAVNNVVLPFNTDKAINRTWHISHSGSVTIGPDIVFNFDDADAAQKANPAAYSGDPVRNAQIWHYNGVAWIAATGALAMTPAEGPQQLTLSGYQYFSPFAIAKTSGPLPVNLVSFSGYREGSRNLLRWTTATESNNRGFEVQRSTDGINYSAISFVNTLASGGNSTDQLSYTFIDHAPAGLKQYYRLKQEDWSGTGKLSNIVLIRGSKPSSLSVEAIFPNPARSNVNLLLAAPVSDQVTIVLNDALGRTVMQRVVRVEPGSNTIPLDVSGLRSGSYFVIVVCSDGCEASGQLLKQ